MGRRASDKFDIGQWLLEHHIQPEAMASELRFTVIVKEAVKVAVKEAVQDITLLISAEDSRRDWRTLSIAALTAVLVNIIAIAALAIAAASGKLKGWL